MKRKTKKIDISAYFFITPSVVMFLFFVLYPIILSFIISFQKKDLVKGIWVGVANYKDIFADPFFWLALKNTIIFVVVLVPVLTFLGFIAALKINKLSSLTRAFFRAVFYLPVVLSGVVISMIWKWIFDPSYGILNYLLELAGMRSVIWMASAGTLYYLMIVVFTFNFGTVLIVYLAAVAGIPEEIIEAARIDGAKSSAITWKIIAPLLKPTTFFIMVTQTIAVFQTWVVIQMLTNGGPARSTETLVFQIYREAFSFNQFGRASALGMVLLFIIVLITLFQKLYAGKDINY